MEQGPGTFFVMITIEMRTEREYISPESEVVVVNIEKGVLSQTEPIVDDPDEPM